MRLNTKPLKDIEIGLPIIADGIYHARLQKAEVKENKAKNGNNLRVQLQILEPVVMTHDEKQINNMGNVIVSRYISLVETESYDPDRTLKELAVAIGVPEDEDLELEALVGKRLLVKVAYKPAEGSFGAGNDVKGFSPIKPEDTFDFSSVPW
jgi:hypothetical protein